ncbi:hypothetical protein Bpfe_031070 [Biomphalaria pfeifferi]|uniref:Uncharacterized protein n=1 Tax=Biomphalaria pfeifferi TaxID=112525 RepID=A0AAD8EU60_BIOPF|nr:hypothetical protein Bpfe_031070 [Biomphalaria pfeifferi]
MPLGQRRWLGWSGSCHKGNGTQPASSEANAGAKTMTHHVGRWQISLPRGLLRSCRSVRVTTTNGCLGHEAQRQRPACLRFDDPAAGTPETGRSGHQTARLCQQHLDKLQTAF